MVVGEVIYSDKTKQSYTVLQILRSGGQAEAAFAIASKSGKIIFIKRLLNIKYSSNRFLRERCRDFEKNREKIYSVINKYTISGASCVQVCDFFREKTFYYVVTDRVEGVPLNTKDVSKALSYYDRLFLFKIIAYSFYPFEKGGIIHGDVKPENILIKNVGDTIVSKLTDFESSFFANTPPEKGYIVGTEPYYSPEIATYNDDENEVDKVLLSSKSDIFSLGIILYEFLAGFYPNNGISNKYCFEIVKETSIYIPQEWPVELKALLTKMLSFDPQKRPGILDVLKCIDELPILPSSKTIVVEPQLFIDRTRGTSASVSIINLNPNSTISFSLEKRVKEQYVHPFQIDDDDVPLRIFVTKNGCREEFMFEKKVSVSAELHGKVAKPVIAVNAGKVSISCSTPNAKVYYTLNGSLPDRHSIKYMDSFIVGEDVVIRSIAFRIGMQASEISSFNSSSKIKMH